MTPALLTSIDSSNHIHLIVGSNPLAGSRCSKSLEVGAKPRLVAPPDAEFHYGLQKRIDEGEVEWMKRAFEDSDLIRLGREEVEHVVDAVFITLGAKNPLSTHISSLCRRLRIPVNVADAPNLCTFSLLSTYSDGPLQIGTTTSGKGCKLAARIRREVASSLPSGLGSAVERLGSMRRKIWEEDHAANLSMDLEAEEDDSGQKASFNRLVTPGDADAARSRRMRWLSQICEYWPLQRLATISESDIDHVLQSYSTSDKSGLDPHMLDERSKRRNIKLVGSGPGHPELLTTAAHKAILSADVILADKLVPAPVMDLIPRRASVHVARKFPGNADQAQQELLELALSALNEGKIVVRLKQGDPYLYGRGAEEHSYFTQRGYVPVVIPGITSALSAPMFASIPATHRSVSDEVLICTGTGRKGAAPDPPPYIPTRTVVFLMALHRLSALVDSLVSEKKQWPPSTPCAVIERASCPDQRVIRTTLEYVCASVEEEGSRPPGLLVCGNSCSVLLKHQQKWVVEEGFRGFDDIGGMGLASSEMKEVMATSRV
ncbi:MAG: hypothetical protein M1831_004492 [Alyxoria varia]|nr:MAG: hypothetical protein M1831_004492 [Alyxoria varia]